MKGREKQEERVLELLGEGRTYREVAKTEHLSISQIHRIAHRSDAQDTTEDRYVTEGNDAPMLFQFFEKNTPLTQVVIQSKVDPDTVKRCYEKWLSLKGINVTEWMFKQVAMEDLLTQAMVVGQFRSRNCANINEADYCTNWTHQGDDGRTHYRKVNPLRCAFCISFEDAG